MIRSKNLENPGRTEMERQLLTLLESLPLKIGVVLAILRYLRKISFSKAFQIDQFYRYHPLFHLVRLHVTLRVFIM